MIDDKTPFLSRTSNRIYEEKILFDLKNDPNELTDISSENLDIQQELDKILTELLKTKPQQNLNELTDEEQQKAKELLKKLGYI